MSRQLCLVILMIWTLLGSGQLWAKTPWQDYVQVAQSSNKSITLDRAVSRAKKRGVRILSAEEVQSNGRGVYRIRVLTKDGKVKRLRIDPRTGKRLPSSR